MIAKQHVFNQLPYSGSFQHLAVQEGSAVHTYQGLYHDGERFWIGIEEYVHLGEELAVNGDDEAFGILFQPVDAKDVLADATAIPCWRDPILAAREGKNVWTYLSDNEKEAELQAGYKAFQIAKAQAALTSLESQKEEAQLEVKKISREITRAKATLAKRRVK